MKRKIATLAVFGAVLGFSAGPMNLSFADETISDKASEAASDTGRAVKKGARAVKDKTCELVNGKMECVGKKVKNKAKNTVDKVEDATD